MATTGGENTVQHLEEDLRRLLGISSDPGPHPAPSLPKPAELSSDQPSNPAQPPSASKPAESSADLGPTPGGKSKPAKNKGKQREGAGGLGGDDQQNRKEGKQNRKMVNAASLGEPSDKQGPAGLGNAIQTHPIKQLSNSL